MHYFKYKHKKLGLNLAKVLPLLGSIFLIVTFVSPVAAFTHPMTTFAIVCTGPTCGNGTASNPSLVPPIPDGCPGSANPQTPPPAVCGTIPIGCPGSSVPGPVDTSNPPTNCPYSATNTNSDPAQACATPTDPTCGFTHKYIEPVIRFLAVGLGVIVTIMIVIGGIQYSSSGGDPQAVAAAKKRITNAILALLAFILLISFLQFIVPGGVLG